MVGIDKNKVCPVCHLAYDEFRTGMTFTEVRATINIRHYGCDDWVFIHRNMVLRKWCTIKKSLWEYHLEECKRGINKSAENFDVISAYEY